MNKNIVTCSAVTDGKFTIKSADTDFFKFFGYDFFGSFIKSVHKDDAQAVMAAAKSFNQASARVYSANGIMHWACLIFSKADSGDYVRVRFIFTDNFLYDKTRLMLENTELRCALTQLKSVLFSYSRNTDVIRIYTIRRHQNMVLAEQPLARWEEESLAQNRVMAADAEKFKSFCNALRTRSDNINYSIYCSLFEDESGFALYEFTANVIYYEGTGVMLAGQITRSENLRRTSGTNRIGYDPMTGLPDIKTFTSCMVKRMQKNTELSMIMVDIDNLNKVNDIYGYKQGDAVIIKLAEILSGIVDDSGIVARFSGDEFIILLEGLEDAAEQRSYLRAIRTIVETDFKDDYPDLNITVSMGCVTYPGDGESFDELFNKADTCLNIAKRYGKNRYIIFDEKVRRSLDNDFLFSDPTDGNITDTPLLKATGLLFEGGANAIEDVCKLMCKYYNLEAICIYAGTKCRYSFGRPPEDLSFGLENEEYADCFDDKGCFVVPQIQSLEMRKPNVYAELKKRGIKSAVQCRALSGDKENVIVSFLTTSSNHNWNVRQINDFSVVTFFITKIIEKLN